MKHTYLLSTTINELPAINNGKYNSLKQDRIGVMLHYDASKTDAGAVSWFAHEQCRVSYNWLVLDNGSFVEIAPPDKRAWHAGRCRSSSKLDYKDANSAFYGISAANPGNEDVTPRQLLTITWLVRRCFILNRWPLIDTWRITTHADEAWPRGRKSDPVGKDPKNPIFSKEDIIDLLPLFSE